MSNMLTGVGTDYIVHVTEFLALYRISLKLTANNSLMRLMAVHGKVGILVVHYNICYLVAQVSVSIHEYMGFACSLSCTMIGFSKLSYIVL